MGAAIASGARWAGDRLSDATAWAKEQTVRAGGYIAKLPGKVATAARSAYEGVTQSFTGGAKGYVCLPCKARKVKKLAASLTRVRWDGIVDTKGLQADWHRLWGVWFFETSPPDLGRWTTRSDGAPEVVITSPDYAHDLQSRPQYAAVRAQFAREHPDFDQITPGASTTSRFTFTGPGTATGDYNAVEWFMGSYETRMTVTGVDRASREVIVDVDVHNESHWESGTRVPAVGQAAGLPRYLVPDQARDDLGPGGTFHQRFVWEDRIRY